MPAPRPNGTLVASNVNRLLDNVVVHEHGSCVQSSGLNMVTITPGPALAYYTEIAPSVPFGVHTWVTVTGGFGTQQVAL